MPWATLQLDPATATERDVKSAYAKLIKIHRPDDDPQQFTLIRDAYQKALGILKGELPAESSQPTEARAEPEKTAEPTPVRARFPSFPNPPQRISAPEPERVRLSMPVPPSLQPESELDVLTRLLREAVQSRIRQKIRVAWHALDEASVREGINIEKRATVVLAAFGSHQDLLAELCTAERLAQQLENDEPRMTEIIIEHWVQAADLKRMHELLSTLRKRRALGKTEAVDEATLRMAAGLAAYDPQTAHNLANQVFPRLNQRERREHWMQVIDSAVTVGKALERLPDEHKAFWLKHFNRQAGRCNWRDAVTRQMLGQVFATYGSQWLGFAILRQRMTPGDWEEMVAVVNGLLR